jgi:hypothetical protein
MKIVLKPEAKVCQSHFREVVVSISFTSGWLYVRNASRFNEAGLTPEQFDVLRNARQKRCLQKEPIR